MRLVREISFIGTYSVLISLLAIRSTCTYIGVLLEVCHLLQFTAFPATYILYMHTHLQFPLFSLVKAGRILTYNAIFIFIFIFSFRFLVMLNFVIPPPPPFSIYFILFLFFFLYTLTIFIFNFIFIDFDNTYIIICKYKYNDGVGIMHTYIQ